VETFRVETGEVEGWVEVEVAWVNDDTGAALHVPKDIWQLLPQ
jgi:hypothetical protein